MNETTILESDRLFQVWKYTVSHRQLLIQSHRSNSVATRLELLFKNVAYMAVPSVMNGVSISLCPPEELPGHLRTLDLAKPWYRLTSEDHAGFVAADAVAVNEDELGYEDPSALMVDFDL